jgi:hypothetical protein
MDGMAAGADIHRPRGAEAAPGAAPRDLGEWIAAVEAIGRLHRITEAASRDEEMGRHHPHGPPAHRGAGPARRADPGLDVVVDGEAAPVHENHLEDDKADIRMAKAGTASAVVLLTLDP